MDMDFSHQKIAGSLELTSLSLSLSSESVETELSGECVVPLAQQCIVNFHGRQYSLVDKGTSLDP